jgi:hypothetical protein
LRLRADGAATLMLALMRPCDVAQCSRHKHEPFRVIRARVPLALAAGVVCMGPGLMPQHLLS